MKASLIHRLEKEIKSLNFLEGGVILLLSCTNSFTFFASLSMVISTQISLTSLPFLWLRMILIH